MTSIWWGTSGYDIAGAGLRGFFIASEIALIVFSALLIVEVIKRQGLLDPIRQMIANISTDYRAQAIIICFALVYFIEGVAGFGTPAIVAVPLLMTLGFKPLHAVILALIGDTIPVSFGAVGLPITFGVGSVLEAITPEAESITRQVVVQVAVLNIVASVLLALLIVAVAVKLNKGSFKQFFEYVPFSIISGLIVSFFAFVTATTFGPELPSIIGGFLGLVIISFIVKRGWFLPTSTVTTNVMQSASSPEGLENKKSPASGVVLWRALYPYALLIFLLILTRLPYIPIGDRLRSWAIGSDALFGSSVQYIFNPLYAASTILLITALATLFLAKKHLKNQQNIISSVASRVYRPYLALILVLLFVQIFIYSSSDTGISMPAVIATTISGWTGSAWPFFAPFVGALGSFLAGSATVSNLIFSGLQYDIAVLSGVSQAGLLSAQTIGASAGNMIALHNIVAALAIAGISESRTHEVLRANSIPVLILVTTIGLIALFFVA